MTVATASEVFEFVGAKPDVQATQSAAITSLIDRTISEFETKLGRKIQPTSFSDVLFHNGMNCEIYGNELFFTGIYRDIYSISSISESGIALYQLTDYGQNNDYFLDSRLGKIIKHSSNWTTELFSIKISGMLGIGKGFVLGDLKQAVIEMVAAKSGLWVLNTITDAGRIESQKTSPNKTTIDALEKYILRGF